MDISADFFDELISPAAFRPLPPALLKHHARVMVNDMLVAAITRLVAGTTLAQFRANRWPVLLMRVLISIKELVLAAVLLLIEKKGRSIIAKLLGFSHSRH